MTINSTFCTLEYAGDAIEIGLISSSFFFFSQILLTSTKVVPELFYVQNNVALIMAFVFGLVSLQTTENPSQCGLLANDHTNTMSLKAISAHAQPHAMWFPSQ